MKKIIALITCLAFWGSAAATTVTVSGRQLLLNGSPFEMQGVTYGSPPVGLGWSFDWSATPGMYNVDFPLLRSMGCNTIRLYNPPSTTAAMDAAYNGGTDPIYVVMGYDPAWGQDYTNQTVRDTIKAAFLNMVNTWKSHPAVLMWVLGNENNLPNGVGLTDANAKGWYSLVNECAKAAHDAEGSNYHPVTTAVAEVADIGKISRGADDSSLPNMDLWAVQIYRGPSFYYLFRDYALTTSKPMIISEYGVDSWDAIKGQENQEAQASTHKNYWLEISANSSAKDPSMVCVGGTIHQFADDWSRNQSGTPNSVHDTAGTGHADNYYDSINGNKSQLNWQDEWCGLVSITLGTYAKTLKSSYYVLKSLWAAQAAPPSLGLAKSLFVSPVKNYPNPFNPGLSTTRIEAAFTVPSKVVVEIYDITGELLMRAERDNVQTLEYFWDGKDFSGHTAAPGVYIARLYAEASARSEYAERKILVIK
jgi:hypothetical protein